MVANGEIWNVQDAARARELSGCHMLMLGRGMVTDPGLALAIKGDERRGGLCGDAMQDAACAKTGPVTWQALLPFIADFWHIVCSRLERRQQAGWLKQWLNFLRRRYPEAEVAYMALRTVNDASVIDAWMVANCHPLAFALAGAVGRPTCTPRHGSG